MIPKHAQSAMGRLAFILLVAMVLVTTVSACGDEETPAARLESDAPAVGPVSGLPVVLWDDLPPEGRETIELIDQDGSFPYDKDGATFGNREGLLPDRPNGYYREYTVITPGSPDRGARRIVGGADGELYYTEDHYESFREVVR